MNVFRHLYIGAVSLAIRLHRAMPPQERQWFDSDGDPMVRMARDFNEQDTALRMCQNGDTWMLIARASERAQEDLHLHESEHSL